MRDRHSPVSPAGARKGVALTLLDAGARLLQDAAPLKGFDVYVVGFHCARDDPDTQMEAPGLPHAAEKALMRRLLNSYGKTWHTWHTGRHDGPPGDDLPLGDPRLMWSFNRDGERDPALERSREAAMHLDVARRRAERRDLASQAHPQHGVDLLRDRFEGTTPVPGVVDARDAEG
jgi:Protein of unknown function (DUF1264)